ncbi:hypothetical protein [Halobacterium noricense]|uniref:hypothetical protein n=1 Tax=Halobacterium noricense TaxID=223182 RepID=UPI001E4F5F48|nr:hypothetical protein [Halobacterium noricense]UHH26467.1 hypothetical protein LT974_05895 [Halobacterium noricense]
MSDDKKDEGETEALSKEVRENAKTVTDGIAQKGKTGDENAGEDGGYGFIRPSAESSDSQDSQE